MKSCLTQLLGNLAYHKRKGFTLIEATLAMLIMGISFGAIFGFQTMLIKLAFKSHDFVSRLSYIKNFFVKSDIEKLYNKNSIEENIKDPNLSLKYSSKKSDKLKDILIEKIDASWHSRFGEYKDTFISFKFVIKENK